MSGPAAAKVLVVDDEPGMRRSLAIMLRREGYEVTEAAGGKEAIDRLGRDVFEVVIADVRMDSVSGIDLLQHVKETGAAVEVILMTAFGTVESAVKAMKLGAFDFVTKPFQPDEILLRVRNAVERHRLQHEVNLLRAEVKTAYGIDQIVGVSPAIRRVLSSLPRIAQTDSTVLVTGESGTGKELIARAIHAGSRRARGPFVSVSCAALPEQLLENELFGHVKGAYTGSVGARRGLFEEADGGTFFLDEIGEAAPAIQGKLLRVLEERAVRRLGDNRNVPVDVRIIAATNRDLPAAVRERAFREDLYYRLNVIRIHVPPLRDRMEDIPLLVRHFLALHGKRLSRELAGISPEAMALLAAYQFPGNVRELSNVIEQAVALAAGPLIEVGDLPDPFTAAESSTPGRREVTRERDDLVREESPPFGSVPEGPDREQILEALQETSWNISKAAERLRVSRNTLRYRMEKYGLQR